MLSMSFKFNLNAAFKPTSTAENSYSFKLQTPCLTRQLNFSSSLPAVHPLHHQQPAEVNSDLDFLPQKKQKLGVVVKPNEKPRVVLKFIWMQNDIGIALDQMIPGHGTIPLSPYYFWPRKDAWEELKVMLESKPWISQIERIHLLNQATDIINLWQTSGGNLQ